MHPVFVAETDLDGAGILGPHLESVPGAGIDGGILRTKLDHDDGVSLLPGIAQGERLKPCHNDLKEKKGDLEVTFQGRGLTSQRAP